MEKEVDVDLFKTLFANVNSQQLLKQLLLQLHTTQDFQLDQLLTLYHDVKKEHTIPLSIFSHKLHPAEALCKYLKEKKELSYQEIAVLLNRHPKSVWSTYQRSQQKMRKQFSLKEEKYHLPLSLFNNRSYSLLEGVVLYMNQIHKLSNKQLATLLRKSPNSIAVLAKRAREKNG